ncbi:MAG TPA: hypothetical protein PJ982_11420 [Lacipirellulaceae bacterium]|nr:hypothetical protein [Lacipirellulaceae bacterium]
MKYGLLLVIAAAIVFGGAGGALVCLAAIPDQSVDALRAAATHVMHGRVLRIYSAVEQTSAEWETTFHLVELAVARQEKGTPVGRLAYVRFQTRRYTGPDVAPPGHYGLHNIPRAGADVTAYVTLAEDGGFDVVEPNGLIAAK